jgi:hypothetical protein
VGTTDRVEDAIGVVARIAKPPSDHRPGVTTRSTEGHQRRSTFRKKERLGARLRFAGARTVRFGMFFWLFHWLFERSGPGIWCR